jgi:hypothetical protein
VLPTAATATTVLRALTRAGWSTRDGFAIPEATWDLTDAHLVVYGRVPDPDTAALAILAAARGAGVVAVADLDTDVGRALLADLARIGEIRTSPPEAGGATVAGPVHRGSGAGGAGHSAAGAQPVGAGSGAPGPGPGHAAGGTGSAAPGPAQRLAPEHRALLDRLANGETIAAAATAEFLSLRTANRRIAQAREILGVRSTREAVLAYLRSTP